jgi:mannosyltransferase
MEKSTKLLLGILILAVFLRLCGIGVESFWIDEAATALAIKNYGAFEIFQNIYEKGQILPQYYPSVSDLPVYYMTLEAWSWAFGFSEAALRAYSALFGVLSVLFIYLLARYMFGEKVGLISAFILAISVPALEFSQEARPYSLVMFLSIVSSYFFIRVIDRQKASDCIWYAAIVLIGLYTHFLFEIVVLLHVLFAVFYSLTTRKMKWSQLFKSKKSVGIFKAFLVIVILSAPIIVRTLSNDNSEKWWRMPTISTAAKIMANFASWAYPDGADRAVLSSGNMSSLSFGGILIFTSAIVIMILFYILAFNGSKNVLNKGKRDYRLEFMLAWFIFPIALSLFVSLFAGMALFVSLRYLIFCLPAFVILVSLGIARFKKPAMIIAVIAILSVMPIYSFHHNTNNQEWREAVSFINENSKNGEIILASSFSGQVPLEFYEVDIETEGIRGSAEAMELVRGKDSFWLVLSFWQYYDPAGEVQKAIEKEYSVESSRELFDLEIRRYKRKS